MTTYQAMCLIDYLYDVSECIELGHKEEALTLLATIREIIRGEED
jgi:hypothetical protein